MRLRPARRSVAKRSVVLSTSNDRSGRAVARCGIELRHAEIVVLRNPWIRRLWGDADVVEKIDAAIVADDHLTVGAPVESRHRYDCVLVGVNLGADVTERQSTIDAL